MNLSELKKQVKKIKKYNSFAVFDFDNTCIINDIGEAVFTYLCKNNLLKNQNLCPDIPFNNQTEYSRAVFLNYYATYNKGLKEEAYAYAARTMAGFTSEEIECVVRKTIENEGEIIGTTTLFDLKIPAGLKINSEIKKLITALHSENIKIWIVSASNEEVVKMAAKHYDLPVECLGMRLKKDTETFLDKLEEPLTTFGGKVDCIKKYIDPITPPLLGAGDSSNDLALLEYSQLKVVVNRNNNLSEIAKEKGWILI